ncbi:hypothetical protein SDC9_141639 [bioreactor metagenome]|uniref:Uncharacterized protein n=1 Tax=bioreactor metagenome TaxID=1076179 RepID=A0A645E0W4_9ZZZZ
MPEIVPFNMDFSEIEKMTVNPNNAREKYSAELNFNAQEEIIGERKIMITALMVPPIKEAITAIPKAFPAFPCCASGYPSNTVAAAPGVPGV